MRNQIIFKQNAVGKLFVKQCGKDYVCSRIVMSKALCEGNAHGEKCINTGFSFYKNILYKNIEAQNSPKIKNILRIS